MGLLRHVLKHAGHFILLGPLGNFDRDHFPQRVLIPAFRLRIREILPRHRFGNDQAVGFAERRGRITFQQGEIKDIKYGGISEQETVFAENVIRITNDRFVVGAEETHRFPHFRESAFHKRSHPHRGAGPLVQLHPVNLIRLRMIAVIPQFIAYVEQDENETGNPQSEADGIDQAVFLVPP